MNMQDTSLEAYFDKVLPNINRKQKAILTFFYNYKNCNYTNAEISDKIGWAINRVTPRVLELRHKGLLISSGRRMCTVTKNSAYAWRLKL